MIFQNQNMKLILKIVKEIEVEDWQPILEMLKQQK